MGQFVRGPQQSIYNNLLLTNNQDDQHKKKNIFLPVLTRKFTFKKMMQHA